MAKQKKTKGKTEQGKKLFAVRKELPSDLLVKWFEWSVANAPHPEKMTQVVFDFITRGDFISKDHILFANKMLQEGKRMLEEFNKQVANELKSI